jgi:alkylhydroperoxidase family enzyme
MAVSKLTPMARIDIPHGEREEYERMWQLSPTIGRAAGKFSFSVYNDSTLPVRVRELMRMRIAQINQCHI